MARARRRGRPGSPSPLEELPEGGDPAGPVVVGEAGAAEAPGGSRVAFGHRAPGEIPEVPFEEAAGGPAAEEHLGAVRAGAQEQDEGAAVDGRLG